MRETLSLSSLLLLLLVGAGQPLAAQEAESAPAAVFPERYRGDGVSFRDPGFNDDLFPVNINNWWGLMNQLGSLVVYPRYDWADYSYYGRCRVVVDGLTGYISGNGHWLIEPMYAYADRYAEGVAVVGDGKRFGYIDQTGNFLVPIQLDGALRFREGYAAIQVGPRCGYINRAGQQVIHLRFARARSFHDGLALVQLPAERNQPGKLGYVNKTGDFAFLDEGRRFSDLGDFREGFARAKQGQRWGFIDKTFQWRIEPQYDDARDFVGGMAAVKIGDKWGYINKTGKMVIEPQFDQADDFDEVLAMVQVGGLYGYINRVGQMRIAPQFAWAEPFFRDYARVAQPPNFGYIGVAGNIIWDPRAPLERLVDLRITEQARIAVDRRQLYNRPVKLPPPRPAIPPPYPPEYLYEEELPRPMP
ncbi:MAG TPA: WG repeat-containing protein [Phycisphaeraceae bacterium]